MTAWPLVVDQIEVDSAVIAALLLTDGAVSRPVEHCPSWSVADVVSHLGEVHRWAAEIVRTGEAASEASSAPDRAVDLGPWLRDGAAALVELLHRTDATRACWTFGLPPAEAGFWRRRQILETAVHLADVEIAVGLAPTMSVELAETGIDEVIDFLYPRQVSLLRTPLLEQAVALQGTNTERSWAVGSGVPTARIAGGEADLLLMLWGRPHGDLVVEGDAAAIAAFRAAALVP